MNKIKELRLSENLSVEKVSHLIEKEYGFHISPEKINEYENKEEFDTSRLDLETAFGLSALARFYYVPVDYLVGKIDRIDYNEIDVIGVKIKEIIYKHVDEYIAKNIER